jgi:hypothetical protein
VRNRYRSRSIEVQNAPVSENVEYAYVFRDGSGSVSERQFAKRYRKTTGSDELEFADRRNPRKVIRASIWASILLGGGAALTTWGALRVGSHCHTTKGQSSGSSNSSCDDGTELGLIFGPIGLILGTTQLLFGIWGEDYGYHNISVFDAQIHVGNYNRALLEQSVREADKAMRSTHRSSSGAKTNLTPVISLNYLGARLSF